MDRAAYLVEWASGFAPDVIPYWDMRNERITLLGDVALVTATTKYVRVRGGIEAVAHDMLYRHLSSDCRILALCSCSTDASSERELSK